MLVANLLSSQPQLQTMYENRYRFLREQVTPLVAAQRQLRSQMQNRPSAAVGRNDSCPCGSGKKYKKCHGAS